MDWSALELSFRLALETCLILVPIALLLARFLAWSTFRGRVLVEAATAMPLVLPPTVLGYYLLNTFAETGAVGRIYHTLLDRDLVFTFEGLLLASLVFNLPFAVQPMQRAFESVPIAVREASWVSGLSRWRTFWAVELPLGWPGVVSAIALTFAHTLGEFGVVLMLGGNIPGETRTISIAIYDRVQAFDEQSAATMSAALVVLSFVAIGLVYAIGLPRRRHA